MSRLNAIFEEDMEMQDALDDMIELDDVDDIIIGAVEDRASEKGDVHLFTDEKLDDDGLTEEEEHQANVAILTDDDLTDDDLTDDLEIDSEIMSSRYDGEEQYYNVQ